MGKQAAEQHGSTYECNSCGSKKRNSIGDEHSTKDLQRRRKKHHTFQ
jgi:hypothetical protein